MSDTCDNGHDDRLQGGEAILLDLPGPLNITVNELHSAKYGFIGLFVGMWFGMTSGLEPILFSIAIMAVALGLRKVSPDKTPSFAVATIRHEPHYFNMVYMFLFAVGMMAVILF